MLGPVIPVIDVAPLVAGAPDRVAVGAAIDAACRTSGFFYVVGHGVDPELVTRLDALAREFFALPVAEKARIAMQHGGRAWRGCLKLPTKWPSPALQSPMAAKSPTQHCGSRRPTISR